MENGKENRCIHVMHAVVCKYGSCADKHTETAHYYGPWDYDYKGAQHWMQQKEEGSKSSAVSGMWTKVEKLWDRIRNIAASKSRKQTPAPRCNTWCGRVMQHPRLKDTWTRCRRDCKRAIGHAGHHDCLIHWKSIL